MKIKAAVAYAQGKDFILEEVELAAPKVNEMLVKIVADGICHKGTAIGSNYPGGNQL